MESYFREVLARTVGAEHADVMMGVELFARLPKCGTLSFDAVVNEQWDCEVLPY